MTTILKLLGMIAAFAMIMSSYAQAKTKTIREVDFNFPDVEVAEIVDAEYTRQVVAQHQRPIKAHPGKIDINKDTEPSLRGPAHDKSFRGPSFDESFKSFRQFYNSEVDAEDLQ